MTANPSNCLERSTIYCSRDNAKVSPSVALLLPIMTIIVACFEGSTKGVQPLVVFGYRIKTRLSTNLYSEFIRASPGREKSSVPKRPGSGLLFEAGGPPGLYRESRARLQVTIYLLPAHPSYALSEQV